MQQDSHPIIKYIYNKMVKEKEIWHFGGSTVEVLPLTQVTWNGMNQSEQFWAVVPLCAWV